MDEVLTKWNEKQKERKGNEIVRKQYTTEKSQRKIEIKQTHT